MNFIKIGELLSVGSIQVKKVEVRTLLDFLAFLAKIEFFMKITQGRKKRKAWKNNTATQKNRPVHYRVKQTLFRCNILSWPVRSSWNFYSNYFFVKHSPIPNFNPNWSIIRHTSHTKPRKSQRFPKECFDRADLLHKLFFRETLPPYQISFESVNK